MGLCSSNKKYSPSASQTKQNQVSASRSVFTLPSDSKQISNRQNETITVHLGHLEGKALLISDLTDCCIVVLDYSSEVTVSKCSNTSLLIGPCSGRITVRNSDYLKVISFSLDLSLIDCKFSAFSLFVQNRPIKSNLSLCMFACVFFEYTGLSILLGKTGLNPFKNQWFKLLKQDESCWFDPKQEKTFFSAVSKAVPRNTRPSAIPYTKGYSSCSPQDNFKTILIPCNKSQKVLSHYFSTSNLKKHSICLLTTAILDKENPRYSNLLSLYSLPKKAFIILNLVSDSESALKAFLNTLTPLEISEQLFKIDSSRIQPL